jgi:hypothetical protein
LLRKWAAQASRVSCLVWPIIEARWGEPGHRSAAVQCEASQAWKAS